MQDEVPTEFENLTISRVIVRFTPPPKPEQDLAMLQAMGKNAGPLMEVLRRYAEVVKAQPDEKPPHPFERADALAHDMDGLHEQALAAGHDALAAAEEA